MARSHAPAADSHPHPAGHSVGSWGNFARHFVEMVVAMMAGMMLLGAPLVALSAALGYNTADVSAWVRAPVMALNMSIGMALWMRYRGHAWAPVGEMSAAMFVPLPLLVVPFEAGLISGDGVLGWMHLLMLPAMLAVMLARRDEYAVRHDQHRTADPRT